MRAFTVTMAVLVFASGIAAAKTLQVGPGKKYRMPCQAFEAAHDRDTIEIDAAGKYDGDVCTISASGLTIRGVNGRPRIDAAGKDAQGKAIWVIAANNTTVENIELSGCRVEDDNGAGIRQEGANLTVRNCYFHDNENGILSGRSAESEILVENSEFARNGHGDGYSHNIYIGHVRRFTLKYSYFHHARGGQLVKSRAAENHLIYNRLTDEGGSNYEIDLPNGGIAYVIGNVIQQSPTPENSSLLAFGAEGPLPDSRLHVINNTFVNDYSTGLFVQVSRAVIRPSVIVNNIFAGPGQICSQRDAILKTNFSGGDPMFEDRAHYDYHLRPGSPCLNIGISGSDPEIPISVAVRPTEQYVHPCRSEPRPVAGPIDIGAYERP